MTSRVVRLGRHPGTGTRSPGLVLDAAASSIRGPRADNEDAACAAARLLAVADGVGGKVGGGVASAVVIDRLSRTLNGAAEGVTEAVLASAVDAANDAIRSTAATYPRLKGMATTLTAVALGRDGHLAVAHIGDARAYLLRDGRVVQLTSDHTFVQGLVDAGMITAEQARVHPMRSIVLKALHGIENDLASVDVSAHRVRPGDRLLVCSDGLSGVVRPETIHRILSDERRPRNAVTRLVRAALTAGTTDNVTAVVGHVMPEGAAPSAPPVLVGAVSAASARPA